MAPWLRYRPHRVRAKGGGRHPADGCHACRLGDNVGHAPPCCRFASHRQTPAAALAAAGRGLLTVLPAAPPDQGPPARREPPSRWSAVWFGLRVARQVLKRLCRDLLVRPVPRHAPVAWSARNPRLLAEQRSPLWTEAPASEAALVEGKVHNLRLARPSFDGIVVPAGQVLSFWRQLGRPSRRRGYVEGRELREGCAVPVPAGGLCQLSNALVRCAQAAGVEIVERHAHTARIAGDGARDGRVDLLDATVFWNYVDLRLRPAFDLAVEVEMDAQDLVVRFLRLDAGAAAQPVLPLAAPAPARKRTVPMVPVHGPDARPVARPVARGCFSCNETGCFRHRPRPPAAGPDTALLLTQRVPEFEAAFASLQSAGATRWMPWRLRGPAWGLPWALRWASLQRAAVLRWSGGVRQARVMRADRLWARAVARALRPSHRHLVVSQALLPALAEAGALAGRTVQVLIDALPLAEIQRRLDAAAMAAAQPWPELSDHRVGEAMIEAEWRGLRRADRLLVVHRDAARVLEAAGLSPQLLDWAMPPSAAVRPPRSRPAGRPPTVVFPASALARKGAAQLAEALRGLDAGAVGRPRLLVLGSPSADAALWRGVDVSYGRYQDPWLQQADLVVLPAIVEHSPRALLAALAHGLPVIATAACGLVPHPLLTEVPAGDAAALRQALQIALQCAPQPAARPASAAAARQFAG